MYPLHKMMRERKTALTVYMSRKKSIEAKSGLSFLLVSLLFLHLCVLFLFPLSEGLYHCCTAITESSRKNNWQMFGEHRFQIHWRACLFELSFVCLCVCRLSSLTAPTEAPEKMHINMRIFGDVT